MTACPFRGSIAALPTPFAEGELDLPSLARLVDFHAEHGSQGVLAAGSTGEAPMLTIEEQHTVIDLCVARGRNRLLIFAGVGTSSTRSTLELARYAASVGADGLVIVCPPYVRPGQRGLLAHFSLVAEGVDLPLALYNNPARTGSDLLPETVAEIARRHSNVVAIKESSGSVERYRELRERTGIALLAGDDHLIAEAVSLGAVGAIGVLANIAPREVAELVLVSRPGGDLRRSQELTAELAPLAHALALESNPVPLKAALEELGLCRDEVRSPLVGLSAEHRDEVRAAIATRGLARV